MKFIDDEWPASLKKALLKLWSMYDQCKTEKNNAVDALMQIELQTADIVGEYKEKSVEAKMNLKKMRKYVLENDNRMFYGVVAFVFLLGLLLGVWCSK